MVEEVMEMLKITDMKNRLIKNLSKVQTESWTCTGNSWLSGSNHPG